MAAELQKKLVQAYIVDVNQAIVLSPSELYLRNVAMSWTYPANLDLKINAIIEYLKLLEKSDVSHPGDLDLADDGPEVGGQDDRKEFQQNQIVSSCPGLHLQVAQGAEIKGNDKYNLSK